VYSPLDILNVPRYYRIAMVYSNGYVQYSSVVRLDNRISDRIITAYTAPKQLQLVTPYFIKQLDIINTEGRKIKRYSNLPAGTHTINMTSLHNGIYIIQCTGEERTTTLKVVNQ